MHYPEYYYKKKLILIFVLEDLLDARMEKAKRLKGEVSEELSKLLATLSGSSACNPHN